MQDLLTFIGYLLPIICEFLLTEPVSYFTAIVILLSVGGLIKRIIT